MSPGVASLFKSSPTVSSGQSVVCGHRVGILYLQRFRLSGMGKGVSSCSEEEAVQLEDPT